MKLNLAPQAALLAGSLAALLAAGCGGGSTDSQGPPGGSGELTVTIGALTDGTTWQLNRPIEIVADRPLDFGSLSSSNVAVSHKLSGAPVIGSFSRGWDPVTGELDLTRIRFQPVCPISANEGSGFEPGGVEYVLRIQGRDTSATVLRGLDGTSLESTILVEFSTPVGTDPAELFFDTRPGPPGLVFRRQIGVSATEPETTRFLIGRVQPLTVNMRLDEFGLVAVDSDPFGAVISGLPLNHHIAPDNAASLVLEFDQSITLTEENLRRIGLDYYDGSWLSIPTLALAQGACGRRGSAVLLRPMGTLPPGAPLRIRLDADLHDLVGQSGGAPRFVYLPREGTENEGPKGARVDAIFESFTVGGDDPGSMEDTTSDLGAPRGYWGQGLIAGVETPNGVSRVRSKWYPIGLAGADGMGAPVQPQLFFTGVDSNGEVLVENGTVVLDPSIIGPIQPSGVGTFSLSLFLSDLAEPSALYLAQPGLLAGDRLQVSSGVAAIDTQVFSTDVFGDEVRLGVGYGCYAPGFALDCVPWNLAATFPDLGATTAQIVPRSFEVYTWIDRDVVHPDHRVTITFDAAQAGSDGLVNESTAYSNSQPWTGDVADLSSQPYDYIRFEVLFELDVSGDGYSALERSPILDFMKIPVDFRR